MVLRIYEILKIPSMYFSKTKLQNIVGIQQNGVVREYRCE